MADKLERKSVWLGLAIVMSGAAIFITDIRLPLGVSQGALYIIPMALSIWLPGRYYSLIIAGISFVLIIIGFFLSPPATEPLLFVILNRLYAVSTIGLVLVIERLQRKLSQRNKELSTRTGALEALYEIGTALSALSDTNHIRKIAVSRACRLLGCDTAAIALTNDSSNAVDWFVSVSQGERSKTARLAPSADIVAKAMQTGDAVIIDSPRGDTEHYLTTNPLLAENHLQSILAVPVQISGKPSGALIVGYHTERRFEQDGIRLLTALANHVAIAVNNANTYEQLKALSTLEERQRLSRELHDGMAQLLGSVSARATATEELMAQGKTDRAQQQLSRLKDAAEKAYIDLRQFMLSLRTDTANPRSLAGAIKEFVKQIPDHGKIRINLELLDSENSYRLEPAVEVQAIRIIQEALSNALKHSHPKQITVGFSKDSDILRIIIADDGRGFDPSKITARSGHFGLQSMSERAESVKGSLVIDSEIGKGTKVTVSLPIIKEDYSGN